MTNTTTNATPCECGEVTGRPCPGSDPGSVLVEYMPRYLRAGHEEARNRGVWPHNGARRFRLARACAEMVLESDPDWADEIEASIAEAERCIESDGEGCASQGGYSDREVRVIEDEADLADYSVTRGPGRPLEVSP